MLKKKPAISRDQALLCIPEKNSLAKEDALESGDLILTYPATYKPFFSKIQQLIRKDPKKTFTRKIQLDSLGVDVWKNIDGQKTVKTLIKDFSDLHRLNYKEAEISVTLFLKSLGEKGLIIIKEPET